MRRRAFRAARGRFGFLPVFLLALFVAGPATAQNAVYHGGTSSDDGDPEKDADGVKNGTVVWAAGKVHLVDQYSVSSGFVGNNLVPATLVIQAGAIVKFGGGIQVSNGRVTQWVAPGGGWIQAYGEGTIRINGAIITDIRDDTVGGDTNGDGGASTPPATGTSQYAIAFSERPGHQLTGSTIKYCTKIGRVGNMQVTNNRFLAFGMFLSGGGYPLDTGPVPIDARPVITGNTFEFAGSGGLDLRGMSALVENNTLVKAYRAFEIGPSLAYGYRGEERRGPSQGVTVIRNNRVEAEYGVTITAASSDSLFDYTQFRAEVSGNTFTGYCVLCTPKGPPGLVGVVVDLAADVTVSNNTFDGFRAAILPVFSNRTLTLRPRINGNRFNGPFTQTESVRTLPDRFWTKGLFLNVENNFWGDPSGPRDPSNLDGITNPRGRGYPYGNGFDYVPFIGGVVPPPLDALSATIASSPAAPLTPGASVSFTATATYVLRSAASGQLFVLVRDADGNILNPSAPGTAVTAGATGGGTRTLPAVTVTVPDDTPSITAEVALAPGGSGEPVRSDRVTFAMDRPSSGITWASVTERGSSRFPVPTAGARLSVTLKIDYGLATSSPSSNGRFEIEITERIAGTKTVLQTFPTITVPAPPGTGKSVTQNLDIDVPLRDVLTAPANRVLYGHVVLKDDAGVVKDKQGYGLAIKNPNYAKLNRARPARDVNGTAQPIGRSFLVTGEVPIVEFAFVFQRVSAEGGDWQLFLGPARLLDGNGRITSTIPPTQAAVSNIPVVPERVSTTRAVTFAPQLPNGLPADVRRFRMLLRLVTASGLTAAADSMDLDVREATTVTAQRSVTTGASTLAFTPVRATVSITANATAGQLTAAEIARPFMLPGAAFGPVGEAPDASGNPDTAGETAGLLADVAYRLIPINRYWALYGTLQETGFTATVTFTYDRTTDFPSNPAFREDSLVVAGLNPLSRALDPLASTLNRTAQTISAPYSPFYDTYVVASRTTINKPVAADDATVPEAFGLDRPYPNPSRGATALAFRLTEASDVALAVYDLLGRRVATLVEGPVAAGTHRAFWTGEDAGAGVYLVRLTAGGRSAVATVVRLR